jgi:hypothetical protein
MLEKLIKKRKKNAFPQNLKFHISVTYVILNTLIFSSNVSIYFSTKTQTGKFLFSCLGFQILRIGFE